MKELIHADVERIMLTEPEIQTRVKEIAAKLDMIYKGRNPIVVCILRGSVVFFADLIRNMQTEMELDFMSVSSYGAGAVSSGELKIKQDLRSNIQGRDVLIVEDIIDTGRTLNDVVKLLKARNPLSLRVVTLLDKPSRRLVEFEPDMALFEIEDHFVIGYGLDCGELYRNLPYIAEYDESK